MQMNWADTADRIPISPLTHPDIVLEFVDDHPGLFETCQAFPKLTAEYAPQLTIPGMGGALESVFDEQYRESVDEHQAKRRANSSQGSALTTNAACPLCDDEWVFRHPTFGDYESTHVAYEYFNGGIFGPDVSPYHGMDHAVWLLSSASDWLPEKIRAYLLDGMANWISWPWGRFTSGSDDGGEWDSHGDLHDRMLNYAEKKTRFKWTPRAKDDALHRITLAAKVLILPEQPEELLQRFMNHGFPENYVAAQRGLRRRHSGRSARADKKREGQQIHRPRRGIARRPAC